MRILVHYALSISAAALLAACGASEAPVGLPDAMPRRALIAQQSDGSRSWMLPEARSQDLLYITNPHPPNSKVFVFSYPRGKLVGVLRFGYGLPGAECSDKDGNVFITDGNVLEYAHGGKKPIETLGYHPYPAGDCSWDPTTGNLAVLYDYGVYEGWVAIYQHATGTPTLYQMHGFVPIRCGYDNAGNLFVDGNPPSSATFEFAELPKGGSALKAITLNESFVGAGTVQWDGKYITVGDSGANPEIIYRFVVSGSGGTSVGKTSLSAPSNLIVDWWIQGKTVIGPYLDFQSPAVYYWSYPAGGSPVKTITKRLVTPLGVTVSVAPHETAHSR